MCQKVCSDILPHFGGRITSREIVPAGRISPFFLRASEVQPSFPVAFVCFFGSRKGLLFVVGRVRFLVKPTFFGWRSARVTGRTPARLICLGREDLGNRARSGCTHWHADGSLCHLFSSGRSWSADHSALQSTLVPSTAAAGPLFGLEGYTLVCAQRLLPLLPSLVALLEQHGHLCLTEEERRQVQEGLLRRVEEESEGRALSSAPSSPAKESAPVRTTSLEGADGCRAAIFTLL